MQQSHSERSEPHPINLHLEFLRRTSVSPALFTVKDVKLGSRTSNLHITLSQKQENGKWADEVEGYITMSNFGEETGITLNTDYKIHPPVLPVDLDALSSTGEDSNYLLRRPELFPKFRRATQNIQIHLVKAGRRSPDFPKSIIDQWVRFCPGRTPGKWTNDALGFVVDMFPQIIEGYVNARAEEAANANQPLSSEALKQEPKARFWYPTLVLNLDVKKQLPEAGVDWLFVRTCAKVIRNGRFDLNVEVRDENDDLVATSTHVSLAVDSARNTGNRGSKKKESKI